MKKYQPSGIAPGSGVLISIAFGILAAIILPLLYIILNRVIPNIWFAAITAALLGIGIGTFINIGVKTGKVRNVPVVVAVCVFCGLLGWYMQWIYFDECMYTNGFNIKNVDVANSLKDITYLFFDPVALFKEVAELNSEGTFRMIEVLPSLVQRYGQCG